MFPLKRAGGGTGRRDGLKSRWAHAREGSTPSLPRNLEEVRVFTSWRKHLKGRDGPTSLDRLAAKLSYNWLFDVTPLPSIYQGHTPDKFEPYYKPHQAFVH